MVTVGRRAIYYACCATWNTLPVTLTDNSWTIPGPGCCLRSRDSSTHTCLTVDDCSAAEHLCCFFTLVCAFNSCFIIIISPVASRHPTVQFCAPCSSRMCVPPSHQRWGLPLCWPNAQNSVLFQDSFPPGDDSDLATSAFVFNFCEFLTLGIFTKEDNNNNNNNNYSQCQRSSAMYTGLHHKTV